MLPPVPSHHDRARGFLALSVAGACAVALALAPLAVSGAAPAVIPTAGASAPGAPGSPAYFDEGRKDCLGTARDTTSKVWYTVAGGVLSDVYEPTIDNTNVKTLQFVVTDGRSFTDLQTRDLTYQVSSDDTGMVCTVTATSAAHGYQLLTRYATDPARDSVIMHTSLRPTAGHSVAGLSVYSRLDAHVNGNGGGGSANGGADNATVEPTSRIGVIGDPNTISQAGNRDYGVPTYLALAASRIARSSVGYAGTASDGLTALDASHSLGATYSAAPAGHVVLTEQLAPRSASAVAQEFDLSLGFGRSREQAVGTAAASLATPFGAMVARYVAGWRRYDSALRAAPHVAGLSTERAARAYYLDANVLKSSEDKTYPGAIVASLASPWGQAVDASALVGGRPVYFGSYREVFARDLYEAFTGYLADGDLATARSATRFLLEKQQQPGGRLPRNSLVNGRIAPDTGGDQLDETAYPILMALLSGLGSDTALWTGHVKPAADFLVAHGPAFGVERWEEQSGYSPSTIAAEIAGLTAAASIAQLHGDGADALLYHAVADGYQRNIKNWNLTSTGPYSSLPYFIRLSRTGDPNAADTYNLGNGGPGNVDQRAIVDGGFQEYVRLGELPATDPDFLNSLKVLDAQISVSTPSGTGYYRYGTSAAGGSADGYGDCYQPSQSSCTGQGKPWPTGNTGTGHLWPVLSGERAESAIALGSLPGAVSQLRFMLNSASGVGLVPEQAWEDPDLAASAFGTDPTTASIGFVDGKAAGSASPLTWAQAQQLRLLTDLGAGRVTDQPSATAERYVRHAAPGAAAVTITSPTAGANIAGTATSVTGTAPAGARISVEVADVDTGAPATTSSATADPSGSFSVPVSVGFGTNVITVAATTANRTGYAQVSVVGQLVGGSTLLDISDPGNDDNGPGTFQYPLSTNFTAGSFDITRFQVLTQGSTVYLQTTLRALAPTFGNVIGAQLLDVYVHQPGVAVTSTAAADPGRQYQIAAADAWSQRLEIQGFAAPVWVDAAGNPAGSGVAVVASTTAKTITIALPASQFGTPRTGWSFAVVLHGQDGNSPDQSRPFTQPAQDYTFGVCQVGGTAAICSVDPSTLPRAMDVITPAGVSQATELDPTLAPVTIRAVPLG